MAVGLKSPCHAIAEVESDAVVVAMQKLMVILVGATARLFL